MFSSITAAPQDPACGLADMGSELTEIKSWTLVSTSLLCRHYSSHTQNTCLAQIQAKGYLVLAGFNDVQDTAEDGLCLCPALTRSSQEGDG